jgi:hypothetical protein
VKDDTLPVRPLIIPQWVPEAVAAKALELYQIAETLDINGLGPAVQRIVKNENMKEVWDQFRRRRRNASGFYYQADQNHPGEDEEERQEAAMAFIFFAAAWYAIEDRRAMLERKWDLNRFRKWERLAALLERAAAEVEVSGDDDYNDPLNGGTIRQHALNVLLDGVAVCKDLSLHFYPRERDIEGRAFSVMMAGIIQDRFRMQGQHQLSMYGIVATITKVALELRDVTRDDVREWCRSAWARNFRARAARHGMGNPAPTK